MAANIQTPNNPDPDRDREIFLEAIAGRKFTLADVIGQAGGDFLKGESPVPKLVQLKTELKAFLRDELQDSSGALLLVLQNDVDEADALISQSFERPLVALQRYLEDTLSHPEKLYELVRQTDFRWGQLYGSRPHFNTPGQTPHPEDEYTHESVKQQLEYLLGVIKKRLAPAEQQES